MEKLKQLYTEQGQSPWLDNLKRDAFTNGELQSWLDKGIRGITSNPSIFAKSIINSTSYENQLGQLVKEGLSIEEIYWQMVLDDIKEATSYLLPIYKESNRQDGYVSLEVSPRLANKSEATTEAAKDLAKKISADNLYIKIPATVEGIPAIRSTIANGISTNITLIFSHSRYLQVMEAYISGLEELDIDDLSSVSSVASFFISRIDTAVDKKLDEIATPQAQKLKGKVAVAYAKAAYMLFCETFQGERWQALKDRGAKEQRPLWASTSTKNPKYPSTLYVDSLIGPNTVNTLPENTIEAFIDSGTVDRTVDQNKNETLEILDQVSNLGIDLEEVALTLEEEGVAQFSESFSEVLTVLETRADQIRNG